MDLLNSKTFHIICNPVKAVTIITSLSELREMKQKPFIVWEPVPGNCFPKDWQDCISAMKFVDVVSPNVNEAASFLDKTIDEDQPFEKFKVEVEEILLREYLKYTPDTGIVVIRCGKHGC